MDSPCGQTPINLERSEKLQPWKGSASSALFRGGQISQTSGYTYIQKILQHLSVSDADAVQKFVSVISVRENNYKENSVL